MYDSNPRAIAVMKQGVIVGHLPRKPDGQNCAGDLCTVQYSRVQVLSRLDQHQYVCDRAHGGNVSTHLICMSIKASRKYVAIVRLSQLKLVLRYWASAPYHSIWWYIHVRM